MDDDDDLVPIYHPDNCPRCGLKTEKERPFCERCHFDLRFGHLTNFDRCIYCQKHGVTEEHVFGKWLTKTVPRRHAGTRHFFDRPERPAFWTDGGGIATHAEHEPGDLYDTTVKNVCAACNGGWMSELQEEAKPIVHSFARGEQMELADAQRITLARWVIMVSINLQCYARQLRATYHLRQELKSGRVPDGWRLLVGRMDDSRYGGHSFVRAGLLPIGLGEGFLDLTSTYFCIERTVFWTLSAPGHRTLDLALSITPIGQVDLPLAMLWPEYHREPTPELSLNSLETLQDLVG